MGSENLKVSNYAAAFIDLLGQRDIMDGCGLLPHNKDEFIEIAKRSVGAISQLHSSFDKFYEALTDNVTTLLLPEEQREAFSHFQATKLKFQRFSDGLVVFLSLANEAQHSPVNGIFGLISAAGSLCLLGLASKKPIRGGADIAWGVELNDSELYGCVIAKAYELESEVAKYPRIVLGKEVVDYLNSLLQLPGNELNTQYGRAMAKACLEMICVAPDGVYMVDFLGEGFRRHIANSLENSVYYDARSYVESQEEHWRGKNSSKLADRYKILLEYFQARESEWVR
jgi:hypothetical protein